MSLSEADSRDITGLLKRWRSGGDTDRVLEELMPLVYDELHRQAAGFLRKERQDHTLQSTALINEAYMKLIDQRDTNWENRLHFFGVAAQAMRRILVDHARSRNRLKRGGKGKTISLDEDLAVATEQRTVDLQDLDEVLSRFAKIDELKARIVELRFFAGLSVIETAQVLDISPKKVERHWTLAKAWLHRELKQM